MSAETGDLISRVYGNFRGVDFRGEDVNLSRSPDSVNMWKDYRERESIRTRPGSWLVSNSFIEAGSRVMGMYIHRANIAQDYMYICYVPQGESYAKLKCITLTAGGILATESTIYSGMNASKTHFFTFGEKVYILGGGRYLYHIPGLGAAQEVEPYVPTTSIGRKPAGGGTIHQDVNKLTKRRINTFLADGTSKEYYTDGNIHSIVSVKVNGQRVTNYTQSSDHITFPTAPAAPATDGQDNVEIEFNASMTDTSYVITDCKVLAVFDNRVFVGGHSSKPNYLWHSSLNDPTYFSDLDYYQEGLDNAAIAGLVVGNNALWAFREPSSTNTGIFYHTPTIDPDYGTIYPSVHSSISTGCVGGAINFNDDIIFFSDRGMEGISGEVTTEQVIAHRSTLVDHKLLRESNYSGMILTEWEGYLLVCLNNKIYLADSRARLTNEDHTEYEWFYWEYGFNILGAFAVGEALYLVGDDGCIYLHNARTFSTLGFDGVKQGVNGKAYTRYWVTPKDRFNAPQKLKTTNKRGCVVEAVGDAIAVSVKVEDTDFEPIGTYEDVTDYFVCRIKRKKWKDIQLKFESEKRFSLETATLEAFIGGYIKR